MYLLTSVIYCIEIPLLVFRVSDFIFGDLFDDEHIYYLYIYTKFIRSDVSIYRDRIFCVAISPASTFKQDLVFS